MSVNIGTIIILPTADFVKPIYELIARLPPYYEINPTVMISVAVNSVSATNGAIIGVLITEFLKDIEHSAWKNSEALLDKAHEQQIALAIINMYQHLTQLFTQHNLWHSNGMSYWKFYRFLEYNIMLTYKGQRDDEARSSPTDTCQKLT